MSRRTGAVVLGLVLIGLAAVDRWDSRRAREVEARLSARAERDRAFLAGLAVARSTARAASDTVTLTRVAWRSVRDTIVLAPLTHADTVHDIRFLPALVRAGDEAVGAATRLQAASEAANAAADSVITNLRGTIDDQAKLLARPAPRFHAVASVLYDPIHVTPAASVDASVRVVGRLSLVGRVEQQVRSGAWPFVAVGIMLRL